MKNFSIVTLGAVASMYFLISVTSVFAMDRLSASKNGDDFKNARLARVSAMTSCFVWALVMLTSYFNYSISQSLQVTEVKSRVSRGLVLLGVITFSLFVKVNQDFH